MNERIKELMLVAFQEHYGDPITPVAREKAVELVSGWGEKFAELIVKECAQVAFEGDLKRAIGQWGADSDILKHFEVEHDVVKTFRSKE
jgi:hypothetical protein